jgi:hypothetical protein
MANVVIGAKASFDAGSAQKAVGITRPLGEDVGAGQPVELRADGKLYKFTGTRSLAGVSVTKGEANPAFAATGHTVYGVGIKFSIDAVLEPGKVYFANAGGLIDDASVAGVDIQGAFLAVDTQHLELVRIGKMA